MNVQEMMIKVFQLAGEPSDLCPYVTPGDPTTFDAALGQPGSLPLLAWINQALTRIAQWEYPDGTVLRFRHLRKNLFFKSKPAMTGDVLASTADTISIDGFNPLNRASQFNGWVLEVYDAATQNTQKRLVIATSGALAANSVLQVHQDWDFPPTVGFSTYKLYKSFFEFVPTPVAGSVDDYMLAGDVIEELCDVLGVRDLTGTVDLTTAAQGERFTATQLSKAIPTMFSMEGRQIKFDSPWDLARAYEILYYAFPKQLAAVTDVPDLPRPFHEAIVQWAVHSIQMREQDFNGAYATKRDLQELMQTLRNQGVLSMENETTGFSIYNG